jgi:hypothetical protein
MMSAVIYLDPLALQPVIDGEWHRTRLTDVPEPGQAVKTLCGASRPVTYKPLGQRRSRCIPRQCVSCDAIFRREQGIPLQEDRIGRR